MKKIAIFQTDLGLGGIQTALLTLLIYLENKSYQIDLYLFEKAEKELTLPRNISVKYMKPFPAAFKLLPFSLVKHFARGKVSSASYDVSIDFNGYSVDTALGALQISAEHKVIWVHSDYEKRIKYNLKFRMLWGQMKRKYSFFDEVAVVSKGAEKAFRKVIDYGVSTRVVSNIIDIAYIMRMKDEVTTLSVDPERYNLVTMGRLVHSKGFDLLLDLFATIWEKRQDMMLYIIGDGPEMKSLLAKRDELGLKECVTFLESQMNPYTMMDQMDGFVFAPRYEGQGIVLLEAFALGLDVFVPKEMEAFNPAVIGIENLEEALLGAQKKEKTYISLENYNSSVIEEIDRLLS